MLDLPRIGPLWIAWIGDGVVMLRFGAARPDEAELARFVSAPVTDAPVPAWIAEPLARYAAGEPIDPATIPARIGGTPFQKRVWTALREVRRGAVRTYAGLAADVGAPRAMRAIGMAMARNPIAIVCPCHRIVGTGLALGGFSGGLGLKRTLLELEGVKVEGDRVLPGQLDLL